MPAPQSGCLSCSLIRFWSVYLRVSGVRLVAESPDIFVFCRSLWTCVMGKLPFCFCSHIDLRFWFRDRGSIGHYLALATPKLFHPLFRYVFYTVCKISMLFWMCHLNPFCCFPCLRLTPFRVVTVHVFEIMHVNLSNQNNINVIKIEDPHFAPG